ncbi:MAG: hypothetical protein HY927_06500 [Elusimicrobia bacterium]|nr:hypothetical protein [Elusimicrobiota bacterium]
MTRSVLMSLIAALVFGGAAVRQPAVDVCPGFLPENDMVILAGSKDDKGIDQSQFNAVLDAVEKIYKPIVAARGAVLSIERKWDDGTVNAYAQQQGNKYIISMFGGLARHAAITQDGFTLVACHEMSHHLGGAPKSSGWFGSWATIEGQADYAANLKCLRRVFADVAAAKFSRPKLAADPYAEKYCDDTFAGGKDRALCLRGSMAGKSVTALFKALGNDEKEYKFETPDPSVVSTMYEKHPKTQCRLDTYFQGSLCDKPLSQEVSDKDPVPGTCNASAGDKLGTRPLCWYKPPVAADLPEDMLGKPVAGAAVKSLGAPESVLSTLKGQALWKGL